MPRQATSKGHGYHLSSTKEWASPCPEKDHGIIFHPLFQPKWPFAGHRTSARMDAKASDLKRPRLSLVLHMYKPNKCLEAKSFDNFTFDLKSLVHGSLWSFLFL
jgi:hypothetical protein